MHLPISDLFDGFEDESVTLNTVVNASQEAIGARVAQALKNERRRPRPATLILIAAVLVAVLCGASAIVHHFDLLRPNPVERTIRIGLSRSDGTGYGYQEETCVIGRGSYSVKIDAAQAVEDTPYIGFTAGWVPTYHDGNSVTLQHALEYDSIDGVETSMSAAALNDTLTMLQGFLGDDGGYFSITAYPGTVAQRAEFKLAPGQAELVTSGVIGQFQAAWIGVYVPKLGGTEDYYLRYVLLYDEKTAGVIVVSGSPSFETLEQIAENLELVVSDIPAPSPLYDFQFIGGVG